MQITSTTTARRRLPSLGRRAAGRRGGPRGHRAPRRHHAFVRPVRDVLDGEALRPVRGPVRIPAGGGAVPREVSEDRGSDPGFRTPDPGTSQRRGELCNQHGDVATCRSATTLRRSARRTRFTTPLYSGKHLSKTTCASRAGHARILGGNSPRALPPYFASLHHSQRRNRAGAAAMRARTPAPAPAPSRPPAEAASAARPGGGAPSAGSAAPHAAQRTVGRRSAKRPHSEVSEVWGGLAQRPCAGRRATARLGLQNKTHGSPKTEDSVLKNKILDLKTKPWPRRRRRAAHAPRVAGGAAGGAGGRGEDEEVVGEERLLSDAGDVEADAPPPAPPHGWGCRRSSGRFRANTWKGPGSAAAAGCGLPQGTVFRFLMSQAESLKIPKQR
eukprot:gene10901-biopygen3383